MPDKKETYGGGCHCGAVRLECELNPSVGTSKCNCSFCTRTRFWKAIVGAGAFRLRGRIVMRAGLPTAGRLCSSRPG